MQKILVIGFGHPNRGDSGVGFHAARQFAGTSQESTVRILATPELKPELAEEIADSDLVLFLGAHREGAPGSVREIDLTPATKAEGLLAYEQTPQTLVTAAKIVYGRCPEAKLIAVTGQNFSISATLSPRVQAALPGVGERIWQVLSAARKQAPLAMAAATN